MTVSGQIYVSRHSIKWSLHIIFLETSISGFQNHLVKKKQPIFKLEKDFLKKSIYFVQMHSKLEKH